MLCSVVHGSPTLCIIWEEEIRINSVIEKVGHLVLVILTYQFLQLCVVSKFIDMLLLFVLHYDLPAYSAFSRIPVACDRMSRNIGRLYDLLTVRAQHRLFVLLIIVADILRVFKLL